MDASPGMDSYLAWGVGVLGVGVLGASMKIYIYSNPALLSVSPFSQRPWNIEGPGGGAGRGFYTYEPNRCVLQADEVELPGDKYVHRPHS